MLLKDYLKYDSKSNQLISIHQRGKLKANSPITVTTKKDGYQVISLKGKLYYVHRVVWSLVYGEIPEGYEIDHIDRNPSNNHIDNLRLASKCDNMRYRRLASKANGLPIGVSVYKEGYRAMLKVNGKRYSKVVSTIQEANQWLSIERARHHKEFSRDLN